MLLLFYFLFILYSRLPILATDTIYVHCLHLGFYMDSYLYIVGFFFLLYQPSLTVTALCSTLCVQEYWCFGLRDADRDLSVPGRGQAGDLSQHFPAQRELHRGGAAAPGPGRPVLHPDAAPQTATVSPYLACPHLT